MSKRSISKNRQNNPPLSFKESVHIGNAVKRIMDAGTISSEEDYKVALNKVKSLMDSYIKPGSSEGNKLNLLGRIVEKYEKEHFPVAPPTQNVSEEHEHSEHCSHNH